jgi:tellurite resistance protein
MSYQCPYCKKRSLETRAKAPYVRGFVLAFQLGYHNLVGCVGCVRRRILREVGLSALIGWFSVTALLINPFLILYNLIQSLFVRPRPEKVKKMLRDMGLPQDPDQDNLVKAGYAMAASMITADGEIDPEEVAVARRQGELILGEFDELAFRKLLEEAQDMPSAIDMAGMFSQTLNPRAKGQLYRYLQSIALSDGVFSKEEAHFLEQVALGIGYEPSQADLDRLPPQG